MTAQWWSGRMLAFDLETTGADPETARIVTASCVLVDTATGEVTPDEWLVDPGIDIPAAATAIHGISTEHAVTHGINPWDAARQIASTLTGAWAAGIPVVIMNASYDLTVLDRELRRHCDQQLDVTGPVFDPMAIDKTLDKWRRGKRTLADLCATYQVRQDDAHTSLGDSLATARVMWKIARKYPQIQIPLNELHTLQQEWRAAWAVDFAEYLARQGKPEPVDGSWPLRPATTSDLSHLGATA